MARRHRRRIGRASLVPKDRLVIRFDGPPGCGKSTALKAVRLLLEDAGFEVNTMALVGNGHDGEDNLLTVRPDTAALADLGDWIASEPV